MPTKRNGNGEQQPYIPAGSGDPSGEYANAEGNNRHAKVEDTPETSKEDKRAGLDALVERLMKNKKKPIVDEGDRLRTGTPFDMWNKMTPEQKKQLVEWEKANRADYGKYKDEHPMFDLDEWDKIEKAHREERKKFTSNLLGISEKEYEEAKKRDEEALLKGEGEEREKRERKKDALTSFENWMFSDFVYHGSSNSKKRWFDRVSKNGDKIIVKVDENQLFPTQYGWGLRLDKTHVQFLKPWAVNKNWFGNEVYLTKQYWSPKKWGDPNEEFLDDEQALDFDFWKKTAGEQDKAGNEAIWDKNK